MSTDTPTEPGRLRKFWLNNKHVIVPVVVAAATAAATYFGVPPRVVEVLVEVLRVVEVEKKPDPVVEFVPTFGWVENPDLIATNQDPAITLQFADTPAGRVFLGDEDVFLWRAVRTANGKKPDDRWYPNINQGSVGSCVGAGFKHGADVVQATAILDGKPFEWKPASAEVIYAGSRVEVGGGRISGDGSNGSWAAKWVREYGIVAMERHPGADLSEYSASRARAWGRSGVPADLETLARQHPVKGTALVKSWTDVKRAIQQGYPVAVCSNQGFSMSRDATGRARPQGSWSHCMLVGGVRAERDGRAEGGFILNSWGDSAHTGPVWPADAPVAGFWADANVIDRMVRQGDSFALADVQGFPSRRIPIDWLIRNERDDRKNARDRLADAFALAP